MWERKETFAGCCCVLLRLYQGTTLGDQVKQPQACLLEIYFSGVLRRVGQCRREKQRTKESNEMGRAIWYRRKHIYESLIAHWDSGRASWTARMYWHNSSYHRWSIKLHLRSYSAGFQPQKAQVRRLLTTHLISDNFPILNWNNNRNISMVSFSYFLTWADHPKSVFLHKLDCLVSLKVASFVSCWVVY